MRGLAYIINSPIPGKTCFKLTSRHKKGWKKENDIHLFPMTIPQRWHSVCWLSSSLFLVFVYFLLLQVSASDRNWFPVLQLCVYSILRFSFTQFIASVRCVEWANCYFWVIIAAMFVCLCLARDDLLPGPQTGCLALQWFSFARVRNIFPFSGERRISDKSSSQCLSYVCVKCPLVLVMVTMSDRNHLLWDEGGHSLATIV